ncbi:unnamed protein product, partial [Symbiodinium necroappetens]
VAKFILSEIQKQHQRFSLGSASAALADRASGSSAAGVAIPDDEPPPKMYNGFTLYMANCLQNKVTKPSETAEQEMRQRAQIVNQTEREHQSAMLAARANDATELVPNADEPCERPHNVKAFDLAGLSDTNFAISEESLKGARKAYRGNWIQDKHREFCAAYGSLTVRAGQGTEQEDDGPVPESACQFLYCPGVCRQSVAAIGGQYDTFQAECNALLRRLRSIRREKGYLPLHGVLMVMDNQHKTILQVHLLTQISFSPFDFSALQMRLPPNGSLPMSVDTDISGVGQSVSVVLRNKAKLLYELASMPGCVLATTNHKAVSLRTILLDGDVEMLSDIRAGGSGGASGRGRMGCDSDSDRDESIIDQLQGMLKRATRGQVAPKQQPQKRKRANVPSSHTVRKKPRRSTAYDAAGQPIHDLASQVDREIEATWIDAAIGEAGDMPTAAVAHEPASSSRAAPAPQQVSGQESSQTVAADQRRKPWKDEKGYCFAMVRSDSGDVRHKHLGGFACISATRYHVQSQTLFQRCVCQVTVTVIAQSHVAFNI